MMARDKVYFISDLHLGANYLPDKHECESRVVRWLDSVKDSAQAIYMLGDILDYWYEYKNVVPKGYVRFFGKLAELSDAGVQLYWFAGNHDIWLFDYFKSEMGITVIEGSLEKKILGKRFYLAHGDGVGKMSPGFRFIRGLFRNRICQILYSAVHPRWTIPFALKCSSTSRENGADKSSVQIKHLQWLKDFAEGYSEKCDVDYYVFGHLHTMENVKLKSGANFVILGDWIRYNSYGEFDGKQFTLCQY